jgi:hypothetical protein
MPEKKAFPDPLRMADFLYIIENPIPGAGSQKVPDAIVYIPEAFPVFGQTASIGIGNSPEFSRSPGKISKVIYFTGGACVERENRFNMRTLHAKNEGAFPDYPGIESPRPVVGNIDSFFSGDEDGEFSRSVVLHGMGTRRRDENFGRRGETPFQYTFGDGTAAYIAGADGQDRYCRIFIHAKL